MAAIIRAHSRRAAEAGERDMRVLVIGAGVVGVTTAWYLTQAGHEVSVIEAASGPGKGATFGNAGGVCPGFAGPWAAPGMPLKALQIGRASCRQGLSTSAAGRRRRRT